MSYFIRREVIDRDGVHFVTFWRGPTDPAVWLDTPGEAAQFPQFQQAREAFRRATGHFPGDDPSGVGSVTTCGGPDHQFADDVIFNPIVGDKMVCPGCSEKVTLDWADGWRNDNGLTCKPARTTHSDHIVTLGEVRPF